MVSAPMRHAVVASASRNAAVSSFHVNSVKLGSRMHNSTARKYAPNLTYHVCIPRRIRLQLLSNFARLFIFVPSISEFVASKIDVGKYGSFSYK
jgi:hypothetical protein